jgi:hypothetical protein
MFSSYNHPFVPFNPEGNIHFWERQLFIGGN